MSLRSAEAVGSEFVVEGFAVAREGFEVGPAPDLSIVTYRWAPPGVSLEETNRLNQAIVDGARHDGRVFLSSTMLDGRYTLRMAALGRR